MSLFKKTKREKLMNDKERMLPSHFFLRRWECGRFSANSHGSRRSRVSSENSLWLDPWVFWNSFWRNQCQWKTCRKCSKAHSGWVRFMLVRRWLINLALEEGGLYQRFLSAPIRIVNVKNRVISLLRRCSIDEEVERKWQKRLCKLWWW